LVFVFGIGKFGFTAFFNKSHFGFVWEHCIVRCEVNLIDNWSFWSHNRTTTFKAARQVIPLLIKDMLEKTFLGVNSVNASTRMLATVTVADIWIVEFMGNT
jgi:hypothetical protein